MDNSFASIVDLPDEILVNILKKLNNLDVLYSLVGTNKKLVNVACDKIFTRSIDLTTIPSSENDDSKTNATLDRFCLDILPRIHNNVECLTVDGCFLERILHGNKYFNLHSVTLINVDVNMASHIFNGIVLDLFTLRYQIFKLIITIDFEGRSGLLEKLLIDIYSRIFVLFSNLKYLDLDVNNNYLFSKSLLSGLFSTTCASSSITHLRIKLHNIDDCFCLLDGRLNQLHTLFVELEFIHDPFGLRRTPSEIAHNSLILLNNTKNFDKLKCFSLFAHVVTSEFDSLVARLLRRMSHLEKLTLSLRLCERTSFIDGTHMENSFLRQMPYLHTFIFDIVTQHVVIDDQVKPSFYDIRRTFIQRGYNVDGYIDCINYLNTMWGRCHVYSVPSDMEYVQQISRGFSGGMFMNVSVLYVHGIYDSYEHSLFVKISNSFPSLRRLTICSNIEQKEKCEEVSSIIEFPHLVEFDCRYAHINYAKQFLSDLNTRLPSLIKLHIRYEHLVTITENFTKNVTSINCAKLKSITFDIETTMEHSKDFYLYFPLL